MDNHSINDAGTAELEAARLEILQSMAGAPKDLERFERESADWQGQFVRGYMAGKGALGPSSGNLTSTRLESGVLERPSPTLALLGLHLWVARGIGYEKEFEESYHPCLAEDILPRISPERFPEGLERRVYTWIGEYFARGEYFNAAHLFDLEQKSLRDWVESAFVAAGFYEILEPGSESYDFARCINDILETPTPDNSRHTPKKMQGTSYRARMYARMRGVV